jgi:hypothetical protein
MKRTPTQPGEPAHTRPMRRRDGKPAIRQASFAAATLIGAAGVVSLAAQEALRIRVAPRIVAAADAQASLRIEVDPLGAVPPKSFLSLRGVPPGIAVTDAHAIDPGSWAVPLAILPMLKAKIPAEASGQSDITISLVALDGRLLAQAKTKLVIQRPTDGAASEKQPAGPPAVAPGAKGTPPPERAGRPSPVPSERARAPERRERPLAPQDRQRALGFLKKGEELFAAGNVGAARLFYERAAETGLAEGALALAATYDPDELARRNVLGGVQADRAAARRWYERARELGAPDAENRLGRLDAREK